MKKVILLPIIFFSIVLWSSQVCSQTVDELIKQGDEYVEEFNNQKALDTYLQADKLSPNNWEIYWRISRAYVDIGEHLPDKTDEQKKERENIFKKSLEYADKAVKLAPNEALTYVRRAIANGRIALFQGVFSAVGTVKDVKSDCEKAIQLGNGGNYVQALAHYLFGRTHLEVCKRPYLVRLPIGLGWGNNKEAVKHLETANKLYPNFRMIIYELAKAYVEVDEYEKAKSTLMMVEKAPVADEDDEQVLLDSKKLYEEIKNK